MIETSRRVICVLLVIVMAFSISVYGNAESQINVTLNGRQLTSDVPPAIIEGRTMLPLRTIFEELGATVLWDDAQKKVTGTKGDTVIELQIGNRIARVNGKEATLEVAATSLNGRTMVPARFISETFGADVAWIPDTRTVSIITPKKESRRFLFFCDEADVKCLNDLSDALESNYSRIISDLKCEINFKVKVYVYPDIITYHKAVNDPLAPEWSVGRAVGNDVKMVSPLNPGKSHTYDSIIQVIVHEFTHVAVKNASPSSSRIPKWANEGIASYEAKQMNASIRKYIADKIRSNKIPSLNELNSNKFADIGGYEFSYTILEYIIKTYGFDKFINFISRLDYMQAFNTDKAGFEKGWKEYLANNYR